jgi:DNA-binding MarR family transcriptional regulator
VTAVLDRLEAAGYLARQRAPEDRRKVLVVPTAHVTALAEAVYGQIGRIGQRHMGAMPVIQMQILTRYLRTGAWINAQLAHRLREEIARAGTDPLATAQAFSARIATEAEALDAGLTAAWQAPL